ncbi:MAG: phosphoribosyl-ATP diphosphatase [Proteobacteria bacterium]|nr:phosphoribosyl-ATP diphosphatase [Pseudomonadota bacterium]
MAKRADAKRADAASRVLGELFEVIEARRGADPRASYVAKLHSEGRAKIAQKLGEEALETVLAAVQERRDEVVCESADLLFHLLVLWADAGIAPDEVFAELERRKGRSGLDEKKSRKRL